MSTAASNTAAVPNALRVAVILADTVRRAGLSRLLSDAGYEIVESSATADVVVADRAPLASTGPPFVLLGGSDDGQAGLLPPDALPEQIDAALRAAAAGLTVRIAGFDAMSERHAQNLLTPRENDVLTAIAAGLSNKAIARHLDISLHTVKFHIESLLRKLGAPSRAEAVAKGLAHRRDETIEI